ncbi:MAG: LysE family translocator [Ignavibacteriaceae bacterium]
MIIIALTYFLKGIIIGFAMALPVGPIGIMCIRKTLTEGRLHGLVIGLGAATADMVYSCIAAFGLTMITDILDSQKFWIRLVGGTLILFLGVKIFRAKPTDPKVPIKNPGMWGSYFYTFFLTLTNPLTIFAFIGVFAALGLGSGLSIFSASALVLGVFIGSALWFVALSSGFTLFRNKFKMNGLVWVNRIAGGLIIISSFVALISLL